MQQVADDEDVRVDTNVFLQRSKLIVRRAASGQKPLGNRGFIRCALQYFNLASWPQHLEAHLHKWPHTHGSIHTLRFKHQTLAVTNVQQQNYEYLLLIKIFQNKFYLSRLFFLVALIDICKPFLLRELNFNATSTLSSQKFNIKVNKQTLHVSQSSGMLYGYVSAWLARMLRNLNSLHRVKPIEGRPVEEKASSAILCFLFT